MNPNRRTLLAHGFIAACCLYACVTLLLAPAQERAARLRAKVNDLQQHATQRAQLEDSHDAINRTLAHARSQLDAVTQASSSTASVNQLFAQLSALARTHTVEIVSLTPTDNRAAPRSNTQTKQLTQAHTYSMTFASTYADAAAFMDAIQRSVPMTTIRTVRVQPVSHQSGQGVRVELDACSFHIAPDTLASAVDASLTAFLSQPIPQTVAATPAGGQP